MHSLKLLSTVVAAFMSLSLASSVCTAQDAPPARTYTIDNLIRLDAYKLAEKSFRVSPDVRRVAVAASDENGSFVVINGNEGARYTYVADNSTAFSPDSKHLAYVAGKGAGMFLVVDEKPFSAYSSIHDEPPAFSPDSSRLAFAVSCPGGERVVVQPLGENADNGQEQSQQPVYDSIKGGSITFSPDGSSLYYIGVRKGKLMMVKDGVEGAPYDELSGPVFGPDGRTSAYIGKSENKWHVVTGSETGAGYKNIRQNSLAVMADGTPVYAASSGDRQVLVTGGKEGTPEDEIKFDAPSPDGTRLAYAARTGNKWTLYIDGKEGPSYDGIGGAITFSRDSKHYAFAAKRDGQWYAESDTAETGPYKLVAEKSLAFSPDGSRLAFTAKLAEMKWVPVVDGRPLKQAQCVPGSPVFSPDGLHVANIGNIGYKHFVAVDGVSINEYDAIVNWSGGNIVFDSDTDLHYLAVLKKTIMLVEEMLE